MIEETTKGFTLADFEADAGADDVRSFRFAVEDEDEEDAAAAAVLAFSPADFDSFFSVDELSFFVVCAEPAEVL